VKSPVTILSSQRRRASQPTRDPRLSSPAPIGPAVLKHCHRCNYHCSTESSEAMIATSPAAPSPSFLLH
jgi:hypothetical protein